MSDRLLRSQCTSLRKRYISNSKQTKRELGRAARARRGQEIESFLFPFFSVAMDETHCTSMSGRAWGGDLIVIVGPGVALLTDLAFPGEGIFEFVFTQRGSV